MLGDHNGSVCHLTDNQLVALNPAMALHQSLVAQVEGNVQGVKPVHNCLETLVILMNTLALAGIVHSPGTGLGMHQQGVDLALTLSQDHANPGHGSIELLILFPPGLLIVHCRRVVALPNTPEAVALQMLAKQIDAVDHLMAVDQPQLVKADIVAAQGKGFRQDLLLTQLLAGRTKLPGSQIINDMPAQAVHAGNAEILIVWHNRTV